MLLVLHACKWGICNDVKANEIQLWVAHNYQHFLKCINYTLQVGVFITNIRFLKC